MGAGGAGGGGSPATPSAGCSRGAGRPAGGTVSAADRLYTFPTSYDGSTPMPLLMAFHANGNPNTQLRDLTNGSDLETRFVRAFPKSTGQGWVLATDTSRIATIYNDLLASYCVDTSRVFATGHSSGAQMIVQLMCVSGGERRFKAVAPVAASRYCTSIPVPVPTLYIQGMRDVMRNNSNGKDVVDVFVSSNRCGATTAPYEVATCNSSLDRQPVMPGCVAYQGCMEPVIWCSHNDNAYNATDGNMHGWPCFASRAMAGFFLGLP
jgi:poly(3-hydroxybutyrate) depolymerase